MEKDSILHLRISGRQKKQIEAAAKIQDVKVPAYVLEALNFYTSFNAGFIEEVGKTAGSMKIPVATVMQNLLMYYLANDNAVFQTFKWPPKAFQRAFRFDQKGMITDDRLTDMCFEDAKKDAETLKAKLEESSKTGKPVRITTAEGAFLATHAPI